MSKPKSIKYQVQGELMKKLAIGKSHHQAKLQSEDGVSPWTAALDAAALAKR